jgi:hypothetical protein
MTWLFELGWLVCVLVSAAPVLPFLASPHSAALRPQPKRT